MIKAVIVDFDDTLCLTEQACFDLENQVLAMMGRPPMSRDVHIKTWGQLFRDAMKVRSPGTDLDEFFRLIDIEQAKWALQGKIDIVDELNLAALDALIAQGKKVYVLTSRTHQELRHILAPDHGLASRVTAFYYREIMEFHKPDPRAFDLLLKDSGLARLECVYVGDSPSDAMAAKRGDLHFVASLESGIRSEKDFDGLDADLFIYRFADLPSAVALLDTKAANAL